MLESKSLRLSSGATQFETYAASSLFAASTETDYRLSEDAAVLWLGNSASATPTGECGDYSKS